MNCPFCDRTRLVPVAAGRLSIAINDGYPVGPGHALVIPTRHVPTVFDLEADEERDLWALVREVKRQLDVAYAPDGYNVGHNAGQAAGQTVAHAHVHVIPRFEGDVPDPRGGIRWVLPDRAAYWS